MKYLYNKNTTKGIVEREIHKFLKSIEYKSDSDVMFMLAGFYGGLRNKIK